MVEIGKKVTVLLGRVEKVFILVPPNQVDIREGKISVDSPIGKAIKGARIGEKVKFTPPSGKEVEIEIINIK